MKTKELRTKSDNELNKMLTESQAELREMNFKVSQRQLKKVRDIRKIKARIARIKTILKERQASK